MRWPRRPRSPRPTTTSGRRPACTRTTPPTGTTASAPRSSDRAASPRCVAIGETGLDWFRDRAPRDAQLAAFHDQLALARRLDLPVVIHCREATDDCFELLADEAPPTVVLHCFAAAERLDEAIERGWYCSFAGNVTYGSAVDLQDAAAPRAGRAAAAGDGRAVPVAGPASGPPQRAGVRHGHACASSRSCAARAPGALAAVVDAERRPGVPAPRGLSGGGRRRSAGRPSQALGITPDTRLGQHFLVDRNIVDVALRLADLDPDDVAVEVGPGAGVLTTALAARVRAVHAIELDRRLEAPLPHVARRPR